MINIRPVSDLRNKFSEIEEEVVQSNSPVFLTKNLAVKTKIFRLPSVVKNPVFFCIRCT